MFLKASRQVGLCVILLVAPSLGTAQKPASIALVPAANWRLVNSQVVGLDSARQWGSDPAVDREYGVKSLERRTYQLGDKVAEVFIEAAADASAAYGLLTFYKTQVMALEPGFQLTLSGPGGTLMGRGRYFVRIPRTGAKGSSLSNQDFRSLMVLVGGSRSPFDPHASLPAALPTSGLLPGSEKYLLGPEAARRTLAAFPTDLLGFSQGAEVETAAYLSGKSRATVIAISYPTPQIARLRFGAMEKFLAVNQHHGAQSIYGKRQGSFIFLVLDASSSAWATGLMDQFKVSQSISWDQRYPGQDSIWVQLAKLVLANLALVGILVCLAIAGGALIFLSRRIAAKWFPSSAWGQPDAERIIRLNLS